MLILLWTERSLKAMCERGSTLLCRGAPLLASCSLTFPPQPLESSLLQKVKYQFESVGQESPEAFLSLLLMQSAAALWSMS